MTAPLVDTHAHVFHRDFDLDREQVFERARQADVAWLVCVGYSLPTSRAALQLAETRPNVLATVGIHPNDAAQAPPAAYAEIEQLAQSERVVGIGETGLDYYRERTPHARQAESLVWHLRLAEQRHLPVIIHNREADQDMIGHMEASAARRPAGEIPGLLHCFSSDDPVFLRRALDAGYYISFAGPLTFRNARALPDMARLVPPERLLVETDCPYLTPEPFRGRRNEPAYMAHTARKLAEVVGLSFEALRAQVWQNTCRVFPALAQSAQPAQWEEQP